MKRILGIVAAATVFSGTLMLGAPAHAMGTGNPYADQQVGVTYTVYQPTFTAGLKLTHFGSNVACNPGIEQNLGAIYGVGSNRQFSITEGNPMCWDIGVGRSVLTTTINGAKATVYAYCDPASSAKCDASSVKKHGGHLAITMPAASGLRPTIVWIETTSANNLSAQQLVQIAKGLKPAV